jgi:hydrogenase-4 transcriptional activator
MSVSCNSSEMVKTEGNGLIYLSPMMNTVIAQIHMLRHSQAKVLIMGESGTGKEVVARAIHQSSVRNNKSLVPYNCSSIPRELAESELFGHRKGAFTGATQDSPGIIRSAEGGTLFLDEIGDLPLEIQPKLLRFLENGEIQPVGTTKILKVDVRVIAATNRDLNSMVVEGKYRADLLYRINTITILLPPLRERHEDIPLLAHHFLRTISEREGKQGIRFAPDLLDRLKRYGWPGNVRELANVIETMVVYSPSNSIIQADQLPAQIKNPPHHHASAFPSSVSPQPDKRFTDVDSILSGNENGITLTQALADLEYNLIKLTLAKHNNNVSRAAKTLGISRFGLQRKLKRLAG